MIKGTLRVWWIPQIPMEPFYWSVDSLKEAKNLINCLAEYDLFQLRNRVKPDYSNTGGLQIFNGEVWVEWESDDGENISEVVIR